MSSNAVPDNGRRQASALGGNNRLAKPPRKVEAVAFNNHCGENMLIANSVDDVDGKQAESARRSRRALCRNSAASETCGARVRQGDQT
jgi:hypothetical protein